MKVFRAILLLAIFAQCLIGHGQNKKAAKLIDKATEAYNFGEIDKGISYLNEAILADNSTAIPYFLRATFLLEKGDIVSALNDLETGTVKDPLYHDAYATRGVIYIQLKQYEKGIADLTSAIELNNKSSENFNNRGFAYMESDDLEKAHPDLLKALELNPENTRARINLANLYGRVGQYQEAINQCHLLIAAQPEFDEAYLVRGQWYYQIGKCYLAMNDYDKALSLNPEFVDAYMSRGTLKDNCTSDETGAIEDFTKAIELDPTNALAYFYRSSPLFDLERFQEVIDDCNKSIELNPNHAQSYSMRGSALGRLGKSKESIEDFEKTIELWPSDNYAYIMTAISYLQLEEYQKAINIIEPLLVEEPLDPAVLNQWSYCYFHKGDYATAMDGFNQMIEMDSLTAELGYFGRALCYDSLGNQALACEDMFELMKQGIPEAQTYVNAYCFEYIDSNKVRALELFYNASELFLMQDFPNMLLVMDEIIKLDSTNKVYYYERGHARRKMMRYEDALEDFNKAIDLDSSFANPYGSIGYSYIKMGDEFKAREYLTLAMERDSTDPVYFQNMAALEMMTDHPDKAIPYYKITIQLNPQHIDAIISLAECYFLTGDKELSCATLQLAVNQGSRKATKIQNSRCN